MKRTVFLLSFFLIALSSYSQNKEVVHNKDTDLLEVTFYHDNGQISQTGSYTLDGKLHGNWLSFDQEGKKITSANYDHGKKVGKWFYWNNETLKEVDYMNNAIVDVTEWKDTSALASKN